MPTDNGTGMRDASGAEASVFTSVNVQSTSIA